MLDGEATYIAFLLVGSAGYDAKQAVGTLKTLLGRYHQDESDVVHAAHEIMSQQRRLTQRHRWLRECGHFVSACKARSVGGFC